MMMNPQSQFRICSFLVNGEEECVSFTNSPSLTFYVVLFLKKTQTPIIRERLKVTVFPPTSRTTCQYFIKQTTLTKLTQSTSTRFIITTTTISHFSIMIFAWLLHAHVCTRSKPTGYDDENEIRTYAYSMEKIFL